MKQRRPQGGVRRQGGGGGERRRLGLDVQRDSSPWVRHGRTPPGGRWISGGELAGGGGDGEGGRSAAAAKGSSPRMQLGGPGKRLAVGPKWIIIFIFLKKNESAVANLLVSVGLRMDGPDAFCHFEADKHSGGVLCHVISKLEIFFPQRAHGSSHRSRNGQLKFLLRLSSSSSSPTPIPPQNPTRSLAVAGRHHQWRHPPWRSKLSPSRHSPCRFLARATASASASSPSRPTRPLRRRLSPLRSRRTARAASSVSSRSGRRPYLPRRSTRRAGSSSSLRSTTSASPGGSLAARSCHSRRSRCSPPASPPRRSPPPTGPGWMSISSKPSRRSGTRWRPRRRSAKVMTAPPVISMCCSTSRSSIWTPPASARGRGTSGMATPGSGFWDSTSWSSRSASTSCRDTLGNHPGR